MKNILLILIVIVSFVIINNVGKSAGETQTLDEFMNLVAADLGRTPADIAPYTQKLKDNWYSEVDQLRYITDAQFQAMGFPQAIVSAIRKRLNISCVDRTSGCSDHGDCVNGICHCDAYYTGEHCDQRSQCQLECQHGGTPNEDCTACVGCRGAWSGHLCDQWNENGVPVTKLVAELQGYAADSRQALDSLAPINPIPGRIGVGVDITTGQTKLPVVKLTYTLPNKTWTNSVGTVFRIPVETQFTTYPTGIYQPTTSSLVFISMSSYVDHMFSWSTEMRNGVGGLFSHSQDLNAIYDNYFTGDSLLTVTQQYYPVYKMVLPVNPNTNEPTYELDVHCQHALDALPPDYSTDTSKQMYQTFIQSWGTSFTTTVIDGGLAEMQTYFDAALLTDPVNPLGKPYTPDQLAQQADLDFGIQSGTGSSSNPDTAYLNMRRLGTLDCAGGDPTLCGPNKLSQWAQSIDRDAIPIMYSLSDISLLIKDQVKRSNIQKAIHDYVEIMEAQIKSQKTCPKCVQGTCTPPNDFCTCKNSRIKGRTCDRCIDGWTGSDCSIPVCNQGCYHGTCTAPGVCQCAAHWVGPSCNQCDSQWTGSNCQTPVCNPACGHGTCVAPNTCSCYGHWAPPTCTSCIAGWHGPDCNGGQNCFRCGGSGKVCNSLGCEYGYVSCPSCGGSGIIPDNVPRCYRCGGSGQVCNSLGCEYGYVTCPGCNGKGYDPPGSMRCPKCGGYGQVCNSLGCDYGYVTCYQCSGRGYV